ncbi:hypothetical protein CEXT_30181 [Caerostris extrusa]|uniref:Uncharacterized protein n=1 Tax=Caerostris extrusa TaxID=172846 RepID=A0AAV4WTB8_CAEEX|nr:hypothetical protein CEXT_30181 [Caerostris extrusa]
MKVPYVCNSEKFEEHYTNQSGSGIPHYEGISFQRMFRKEKKKKYTFVVNSEESSEPGSHWLAFYCEMVVSSSLFPS